MNLKLTKYIQTKDIDLILALQWTGTDNEILYCPVNFDEDHKERSTDALLAVVSKVWLTHANKIPKSEQVKERIKGYLVATGYVMDELRPF